MSRANESDIYSVPNSRRFAEEFPRSSIKSNCADRTLKALKESTRERRQMGGKEEEWEERLSDSDEFVDGVEARARILEEEKQFENSPRSKFCELDGRWENLNHEKENSWEPSYHTPPRPQAHSPYSPLTQMDKTQQQQHNRTEPLKIKENSKDAEEIQRKLQEEIMHNAKAKNPTLDRLRSLRSKIPVHSPSSPSASTSIRHQTSALASQDNSMLNVFSTSIPSSPGQHIVSTPKGVPFGSRLPRPRFEEMFGDISRIGQTQLEGPESSQQQSQAQSSSESIVFRQGDIKQLLKASKSDPSKLIELLDAQRRNARGNKLPPQPIPVTVEKKSVEVRKEVPVTAETSRRKEESRDKQTKRDETKQVANESNVHRVKQKQVSPLSIYTTRILFGCVSLNDQLKMTEVIKNNTDQEIIVTVTVDSKSKLGGFQVKIKGANRAMLKAGEEAILETSFCPSITGRFQSACILKALPHDVTYKIPLLGWGDTAKLNVVCGGDVQMGRNGDFAMVTSNFATLKFELKNSGRREAYAKIQLLWSKDGTPISSALFFPSDQIVIARGKTQEVMIRLPDQLSEMLQQLQLSDRPDSAMSARSSRSTSRISTVSSQFESSAMAQSLSQSPQRFKIRIYWGEELLRRRLRDLEQATAPENRGDYQFNGISFTGQFLHEEATNRYDCFPNRKDDWRMFQVSIRTIDITVRPNRINSISRQRSTASLVPDNLTVHQLLDPEATLLGSPRQHMSTVIQEDVTRLNSILK
ncbi:hypothetical protein WR25_10338 isoform C [Diploscapter pachys]|nr:hypothetical protein WR25_10338 isoform C [Diploscapter pachys]